MSRKFLLSLNLFLIVGAIYGGLNFVLDPSGESLGADTTWLDKVPVKDFFLPGLFLIVFYALVPHFCIIFRNKNRKIATVANGIVGTSLILWVVFQFFVLPEQAPIQFIMLTTGVLIATLSAVEGRKLAI